MIIINNRGQLFLSMYIYQCDCGSWWAVLIDPSLVGGGHKLWSIIIDIYNCDSNHSFRLEGQKTIREPEPHPLGHAYSIKSGTTADSYTDVTGETTCLYTCSVL